jgi:hypothetical protein
LTKSRRRSIRAWLDHVQRRDPLGTAVRLRQAHLARSAYGRFLAVSARSMPISNACFGSKLPVRKPIGEGQLLAQLRRLSDLSNRRSGDIADRDFALRGYPNPAVCDEREP